MESLRRVCHVHCLTPEPLGSNSAWLTSTNSGCSGPLLQTLNTKTERIKGKRKKELSHPQLFSQVSLRRTKMLFGPTAQRQNRRWKYLFVSKALGIPGWKAHLGCNLLQLQLLPRPALSTGSRPLTQVLGQEVPPPHWGGKVGSLSQQKLKLLNKNYPYWHRGAINSPVAPVESPELALCQRFYINQGLLGD